MVGATPTALRGRVFERQTDSHAHAKPWAWHPIHKFELDSLLRKLAPTFASKSADAPQRLSAGVLNSLVPPFYNLQNA